MGDTDSRELRRLFARSCHAETREERLASRAALEAAMKASGQTMLQFFTAHGLNMRDYRVTMPPDPLNFAGSNR